MQTKTDLTKLYAARFYLSNKYPYLAHAIFAMKIVVSPDCPTMGVDQYWRLYVNPDFLDQHSMEELAAVVYHEVLHLLWDHHGRRAAIGADHRLFNVSADLEVNDNIRDESFTLPKDALLPNLFSLPYGLLAEEYYSRLLDQAETIQTQPHPMAGQDGSGAGGEAGEWELGPGNDAISPGAGEVVRQAVAQAITEHVNSSRNRGNVPAGLRRWAEQRLAPKVDWRKALRAALRQGMGWTSGQVDYRYDRPSRRQSVLPQVVLPRLRAPQPSVAIIIDTSGSMSDQDLARALAEVGGVLRATGTPVDVLAGDVGVHVVSQVLRPEQVELVGGGGTDMGQALLDLAATKKRYGLVVVLTDGYTPWCETNPLPCPVLVVITDPDGPEGPSWATTIKLGED